MAITNTQPYIAQLKQVSKSFGSCTANSEVSLNIRAGTIHALIGENGAGKSTAMKLLFGMHRPDAGQVLFQGKDYGKSWNPRHAFQCGVGMVHQHFMLVDSETVLDNIVLGVEKTTFGFRKRKIEKERLEKLMQETGLHVDLEAPVRSLSISQQNSCEILKVLYREAKFLILDEPTAVLAPQEVELFLNSLLRLKEQGKTLLIVTHKLHEVMKVADEVTILRAGRNVGFKKKSDTTAHELSELMIGRKLALPKVGPRKRSARPSHAFQKLNVEIDAGEIIGVAGVEGNGQDQLIESILGNLNHSRKSATAYIPADRHRDAVALEMNLLENLFLGREQMSHSSLNPLKFESKEYTSFLQKNSVRPAMLSTKMSALSGGNQQKLVVARELDGHELNKAISPPQLIVAAHPTRGVDLGAIEHIHTQLLEHARRGASVVLISSELEELMNLSHRIGVLYKGQICHWFCRSENGYDANAIGLAMMTGVSR